MANPLWCDRHGRQCAKSLSRRGYVLTQHAGNAENIDRQKRSNLNKDGTIVFKLDLATSISFGAPGTGATGTPFTWDARAEGTTIGAAQVITGTTYVLAGAGAGFLETVQSTSGEEYTRIGNTACGTGVPNASLTAAPTSGSVPLTVNFDASASSVPQSCNTIASYALDFGDGSAATQS